MGSSSHTPSESDAEKLPPHHNAHNDASSDHAYAHDYAVMYEVDWLVVDHSVEHSFNEWLISQIQTMISSVHGFDFADVTSTTMTNAAHVPTVQKQSTNNNTQSSSTAAANFKAVQLTSTFYVKTLQNLEDYLQVATNTAISAGDAAASDILSHCVRVFGTSVRASARIRMVEQQVYGSRVHQVQKDNVLHSDDIAPSEPSSLPQDVSHAAAARRGISTSVATRLRHSRDTTLYRHNPTHHQNHFIHRKIHSGHHHRRGRHRLHRRSESTYLRESSKELLQLSSTKACRTNHDSHLAKSNTHMILSQDDCATRWSALQDDPGNRWSIFEGLIRTWEINGFDDKLHMNRSLSMCCGVQSRNVNLVCHSSRNARGDLVNTVQILELFFPQTLNATTIAPLLLSNLTQLHELQVEENRLSSLPDSISQLTQLRRLHASSNRLSSLPMSVWQLKRLRWLDVSVNGLSALPESISQLTRLQHLDVSLNQLSSLPQTISQLTQLQKLDVSQNHLISLPESISQLSQMQWLDVDSNQLSSLPDSISQLTQLQYLRARSNRLSYLPDSISQLTKLQLLHLTQNQLSSVPESISQLTQLQLLYLNQNQLSSLPQMISQLTQLQQLDVSQNHLTSLPESISQLTQMQILDAGSNQLSYLPESISLLTQLYNLDLSSNQLTSLPNSISNLTQLQYLDLSSNQLSSLSESISQLTTLQWLDISHNQLSYVPESISDLTQLRELFATTNQLFSLPDSISQLTMLERLDISHNQLCSLPESISQLTRLLELDLSFNQLTSLPESISNLTQLLQLDVGSNHLISLPESISQLTQLILLYAHANQITSIPDSISQLTQLQLLYVPFNRLSSLPESLSQLAQLLELNVNSNQLVSLPESISQLTQLSHVFVNSNHLSSLPESISQLTLLQQLDVSSNQLSSLPESISQLTQMQYLDVSDNQLSYLPASISKLMNLHQLSLASNRLASLPESISQLAQLQQLDVSSNQLISLPESISQLSQLQTLEVGSNMLASLPTSFADLSQLSQLGLARNRFHNISIEALPITSLRNLDVSENFIRHFDASIERATSLVFLNASHNFIQSSFNWTTMNLNVLDLTNNSLETVPTDDMLSGQPRFVYLAHNKLRDLILHVPSVSADVTGFHPRLRVLDLSFNKFGTSSVGCTSCRHYPSSWRDLAAALEHSNVELLNLTGNPLLHFGFRDSVLLCDSASSRYQSASNALAKFPVPDSGCFSYGPATHSTSRSQDADADSAAAAAAAVVCQSLYYIGPRAWGISAAFASTGTTPPSTSIRIDADPSIVAYDSCTLPAFAYPVFAQPQQLILRAPGPEPLSPYDASSSSRKQLVIPQEWFGKSELAIPVAAPRCPDIAFEQNACGVYGGQDDSTRKNSINYWQCALDGHDPRSYMCSRCFEDDGYIKDGALCRECSSDSQWVVPVLLVGGLCAFVVYIAKFADATSYLSSTVLYHMQMVAFLSRGPIGWSKFVRDYFFSWIHVSNVDTTSLGCLWPAMSQSYEQTLIGSLCMPLVLCLIFTMVCALFHALKKRRDAQSAQTRHDWAAALLEIAPNDNDHSDHDYHGSADSECAPESPLALVVDSESDVAAATTTVGAYGRQDTSASNRSSVYHLWWKLNLYAFFLLYAPLTLRIAQAFGSYSSLGVSDANSHLSARLAVDLEVEYGGTHWQHSILPLALLGGVVYIIGIPVLLYLSVHGHCGEVAASAGSFLTRVFQPDARLLRGVVSQSTLALWLLCSKGMLAILVGLTSHSSVVPILFVVMLLLLMLVLVTRSSPFLHHDDNVRSYLSFSVLIATYAGAALLTDESSDTITGSQHLALSWILVLGNIATLGWMLWTYLRRRYQA
jgi:Leucine-rich repeat (LRR) protein/FtsH-binding integral membrane protein